MHTTTTSEDPTAAVRRCDGRTGVDMLRQRDHLNGRELNAQAVAREAEPTEAGVASYAGG